MGQETYPTNSPENRINVNSINYNLMQSKAKQENKSECQDNNRHSKINIDYFEKKAVKMLSSKAKIILKGWSLSTGHGSGMHIKHYVSISAIFYFSCQHALLYGRLWLRV